MTTKLSRELLYGDAVKQFETLKSTELNRPITIRDISLEKLVKHTYSSVGVDDSLITAKVVDQVVRGAEEDENLWKKIAAVTPLDTEIQRVPVITPDDYIVYDWVQGTKARSMGGAIWAWKFDCSQSKGLHAADINFTKNDLRAGGFGKMEDALWCAGQSIGRHVLQAVVSELTTDVNAAMTDTLANWGAGHYKALVKMESLLAKVGMSGKTVALVNPDEGYDIGISDYFINQHYIGAAKGIPEDLHTIGDLYGRIPIYRHRDMTAASMIMALFGKAVGVGLYQDIQIDDYEDVREGIEGAIASIQFDVKSGKDVEGPKDATSPIAKSWAVCTVA